MNGGKETQGSSGRNKTAQFSFTEWLSNCLTQWKRSQNITAKYLWNKMYNNAGTWHEVQAHYKGPYISDLTELKHGSADARQDRNWKTMIDLCRRKYDCLSISNMYVCMNRIICTVCPLPSQQFLKPESCFLLFLNYFMYLIFRWSPRKI